MIGWAAALAMFPLFAFVLLPPFRRTHGGNAEVDAVFWAFFAVAVRAAVALVLRNRSRWWLLYIALYFLLPIVAAVASECWRRTH